MKPFLVGSHVYGTPTPESDIDLVVRLDPEVAFKLYDLAGQDPNGALRFGKLNIICALDDEQYEAWTLGLASCLALGRKVDPKEAKEIFRSFPAIHGSPSA